MSTSNQGRRSETRAYAIGYGLSLLLTAAAFSAVHWQSFAALSTLIIIMALGLAQMIVQFRFFLHISFKQSARTELLWILFSTLIIALMVSGTLVVLLNLRARMM